MEKKHKKFNFAHKKDCALKALSEVNRFLNKLSTVNKFKKISHCIKPH